MTAVVRPLRALVVVLAPALLIACGDEGAPNQDLISITPSTTATTPAAPLATTSAQSTTYVSTISPRATTTPLPPRPATEPVVCPPEPEPAGPQGSNLQFGGPCSFVETAALGCQAAQDDFYVRLHRTLQGGLTLTVSVNVEFYKGPGRYPQTTEIIMEIPDGDAVYEWTATHATMTVVADGSGRITGASVDPVELQPEPGTPTKGTEALQGDIACA